MIALVILWLGCGDRETPQLQIKSPADGEIVKGTVNIEIEATDNKEVKHIELYIDNTLEFTDSLAPYSYSWTTTSLPDSSYHKLLAKAYDQAENEGISDTVSVLVFNGGTAKWAYYTGGEVKSSPAISSAGIIYFGSNDGSLYAMGSDAIVRWRCDLGSPVSSPSIAADGTILVPAGNYLCAVTAAGGLRWRYATGGVVARAAAISSDGTIYFGSEDSCIYALNPDSTLKWRYQTGGGIFSSPAIGSDGTVYAGARDNYVYALNPTGTLKWRYFVDNWIEADPSIGADGTVYAGTLAGGLYALNPSGTLRWRYQAGSSINSSPAISSEDIIYFGCNDGFFYAVTSSGSEKWRYQLSSSVYSAPALTSDSTIYFGALNRGIYAISTSGSLKWRYRTGGAIYSSPAIGSDGTVYVGSNDFQLYALQGTGALASGPWPIFHHDLRHTGRAGSKSKD